MFFTLSAALVLAAVSRTAYATPTTSPTTAEQLTTSDTTIAAVFPLRTLLDLTHGGTTVTGTHDNLTVPSESPAANAASLPVGPAGCATLVSIPTVNECFSITDTYRTELSKMESILTEDLDR